MNMKSNFWIVALIAVASIGCNMGNAPEPMNEAELKSAIDKMPAKDQIDYINASPMPKEMKEQRIAEIKKKAGMN